MKLKSICLLLISTMMFSIVSYADNLGFAINVKNTTDADLQLNVHTNYNVAREKPSNYMWQEFITKAGTEETFILEGGLPDNVQIRALIPNPNGIRTKAFTILGAFQREANKFVADKFAKGTGGDPDWTFFKGMRLEADFRFDPPVDKNANRGGSLDILLERLDPEDCLHEDDL